MKAIMLMFDSLNRHMLSPYGCDWIKTPNFDRLAGKSVRFDNSYTGSLPCMPARRELHTGRLNFLHRSWGPMEPFDDSMPALLKNKGIHTCLISDHHHYWEEGGSNYHTKYSSWEIVRGQEGDPYIGRVKDPHIPDCERQKAGPLWRQDFINREYQKTEESMPQYLTYEKGISFIERNSNYDNWFVQIETFDPHEPFYTQAHYKALYPHKYSGRHFDWTPYRKVEETPEEVNHMRMEYAALVSMCDHYLGKVLNLMDELDLWKDTMLIVNTDHGILLSEHGWWAKCTAPFYNEVVRTPFFIWDPRAGRKGEANGALVQTIDIAPTLLDFFGVEIPKDMQGFPLLNCLKTGKSPREALLFGIFGGHINCTDGRYVYMLAPHVPDGGAYTGKNLYNYTLMPAHIRNSFTASELKSAELVNPFKFTKGIPVLKTEGEIKLALLPDGKKPVPEFTTMLFDLETDPLQQKPFRDPKIEEMMKAHIVRLMKENEAPKEQFERMGLSYP
ncbi:MAG: sulfatase [Treponema sp.]|nr:sulfatase [Treponema sp.]